MKPIEVFERRFAALLFLSSFIVTGQAITNAQEKSAAPAQAPAKSEPTRATYLITGLHCPPCTATVEGSLRSARGISSVKVDWNTKNARVEFDERVLSAQKVSSLIAATPHMMGGTMRYGGWLALKVAGVGKEETAKQAQEALSHVKGVGRVVVYPKQESVGIAFASDGDLTVKDLIAALDKAGLKATSLP